MIANRRLCFLIADSEHARLVEADVNNVLRTVRSFDSASAHLASHDIGSGRPGRSFESATLGSHGVAPRHDSHKPEEAKFSHFVADAADSAAGEIGFDSLVLVAPAHCPHAIEDAMDAHTAAMVTGRLAKDLVKTPDYELSPHLREWIAAPLRASS
jgi:protein required for attachment to host cells